MDELKVSVVKTERLVSVRQARPALLDQEGLVTQGTLVDGQLRILVSTPAFLTIDAHSASDLQREVGGFLVGLPYQWEGQMYVEIVDALPGEETRSGAAHLTITPETWSRAQQTARVKFPGLYLVGWYHTHPRMSVFMSAQDIAIHDGFFQEPWHVALVVEPLSREAGFFVWEKGIIRPAGSYQIAYPDQVPPPQQWQLPSLRTMERSGLPPTIDEFGAPGYYHTRWSDSDDLAVRVSKSVLVQIGEWRTTASHLAIGLCLGWRRSNYQGLKPSYFVDVRQIAALISIDAVLRESVSFIADRITSALDVAQGDEPYTILGWYFPEAAFQRLTTLELQRMHRMLFKKPWQFVLGEAAEQQNLVCVWWDSRLDVVTRPLYEVVPFSSPPETELGDLVAQVVGEHLRSQGDQD